MKIEIDENVSYTEEIVKIQCRRKTSRIHIMYAETVDRKTFLYSEQEVYCYKGTLTKLEEELKTTSFLRISKTTLLNVRYLNYVKPYANHRLKATLTNGESLLISRNYIQDLKEYLRNSEV